MKDTKSIPIKSDNNHILTWAKEAVPEDIMNYSEYEESSVRKGGHRQGIAQRAPTNKQACQVSFVASAIAELVANELYGGTSYLVDDTDQRMEEFAYNLYETLKDISDQAANENTDLVHITKAETIVGDKTFNINPKLPNLPATDNEAANKRYVDNEISKINDLINKIYPVGAIYITLADINPSTIFDNTTWERIQGHFLLASQDGTYDKGTTGGNAKITLQTTQLPSHNHTGNTNEAGNHEHEGSAQSAGNHSHGAGTLGSSLTGRVDHLIEEGMQGESHISGVFSSPSSTKVQGYVGDGLSHELVFDGSGRIGGSTASAGAHGHTLSIDADGRHTHSFTTNATGSGQSINIMPPYLAVNMWKRIK